MTEDSLDNLLRSLDYHLSAKNRAETTKTHYATALRRFYQWLADSGEPLDLGAAGVPLIERYFAELRLTPGRGGRPIAQATVRYHFSGLQAVYKWLSRRDGWDSPMRFMEAPSVAETDKDVVSVEQSKRVLGVLDRTKRLRDAAIVSLLVEGGMRVSELVALDCPDVDWKASTVILRDTKNGDVRHVPFGGATGERLDLWVNKRRKSTECLFYGNRGGRLTRSGVLQMVKKAYAECGIPNISPHDLRHSMATGYMDANPHGENDLMVVGGWKSDTMVRRYSKKGRDRRGLESFRANNPMSRL